MLNLVNRQVVDLAVKAERFHREVIQKSPPRWLSVIGHSGTGKTHIAKRLWQLLKPEFNWRNAAYNERVIYWPEFVEDLRERIREQMGTEPLTDLMKWPLLVLDDIGAEQDKSGFASEKLNMLIAKRVGKWTVITSNLDLAGLSNVDERISDRIVREPGNDWIEMTCDSYAITKLQPV